MCSTAARRSLVRRPAFLGSIEAICEILPSRLRAYFPSSAEGTAPVRSLWMPDRTRANCFGSTRGDFPSRLPVRIFWLRGPITFTLVRDTANPAAANSRIAGLIRGLGLSPEKAKSSTQAECPVEFRRHSDRIGSRSGMSTKFASRVLVGAPCRRCLSNVVKRVKSDAI
jgi:hypothetical protein